MGTVARRLKVPTGVTLGQTMRLVRKTTLLNQEWKRNSPDQKEFLEQLRDPKQCPVFEDVFALIQNDLEFICSCFSICMETDQFTEKFLPLFSLIEDWICEDKQTPTTAINDSNISIDINDSIENIDNDSNSISNVNNTNNSNNVNNNSNVNNSNVNNSSSTLEMDIKWLYDYSFCLAVDCEKVAALKSLLEMADNATLLAKPPQDNNEALIRACEINHFEFVKMMVSKGYRLQSFHEERQKILKSSPFFPFFPFDRSKGRQEQKQQQHVEGLDSVDEVSELHIFRMMARPAYILSCYTSLARRETENNFEKHTSQCSCNYNNTISRFNYGLQTTVNTLKRRTDEVDQIDNGRVGLQTMMALNISESKLHLCPNNKYFKPSQNCRVHSECNDPIFRCFDLAKSASKLANKTPEYRSEFSEVARQCRELSVQLLDQCLNTAEVQILLSVNSGTSKYFRYSKFLKYPRIRLAIEHNHKEFVGHMYCQQMLRQEWQGGLPWLGKSYQHRVIYSILLNLFAPFFILFWSITQIGKDIQWLRKKALPDEEQLKEMRWIRRAFFKYLIFCSTATRTIDKPINRFIIFTGYYIVYLVFLILALNEPVPKEGAKFDDPANEKYNTYIYGITVYACAMVWQDLKMAITLRSVKTFFFKFWRAFDLLTHVTLVAALISRGVESHPNMTCDPQVCNGTVSDPCDPYYECPQLLWTKASDSLLSLAATASIIRIIYWFLLIDTIGPVVINMSRAIVAILTIMITFAFVIFAFASGMVFLVAERNKYLTHTNTTQWGPAINGNLLNGNVTYIGYKKMMVNLLWLIFDPKMPEFFGTDDQNDDAYATVGYFMTVVYLLIIVIVLLNLLIAMMNATVQKVHDRKQLYWKFARTSVWMEYFDGELSSPPIPFSFVQVFWSATFFTITGIIEVWRFFFSEKKKTKPDRTRLSCQVSDEQREYRTKHINLMIDIADRYVDYKMMSAVNNAGTRNNLENSTTFNFNTSTKKAYQFKKR